MINRDCDNISGIALQHVSLRKNINAFVSTAMPRDRGIQEKYDRYRSESKARHRENSCTERQIRRQTRLRYSRLNPRATLSTPALDLELLFLFRFIEAADSPSLSSRHVF